MSASLTESQKVPKCISVRNMQSLKLISADRDADSECCQSKPFFIIGDYLFCLSFVVCLVFSEGPGGPADLRLTLCWSICCWQSCCVRTEALTCYYQTASRGRHDTVNIRTGSLSALDSLLISFFNLLHLFSTINV